LDNKIIKSYILSLDKLIYGVKIQTNKLHSVILWLKLFDRPLSTISGSAAASKAALRPELDAGTKQALRVW
jgi:hypothetical protein